MNILRALRNIPLFLFAWFCYGCGDLACRIMELNDDSERWVQFWYPVYNHAMILSSDTQDLSGQGGGWWPWET